MNAVFLAMEESCHLYTSHDGTVRREEIKELNSGHEDADTKIIFYADYITKQSRDIPTIVIEVVTHIHQMHLNSELWMDTGTSATNTRRFINMAELAQPLTPTVCSALPAFHVFIGCDFTAAFLKKAKVPHGEDSKLSITLF